MKIKTGMRNNYLEIVVKLEKKDEFSQREFNIFSGKTILNFLTPSMPKKNVLVFTGPPSVSIAERLKNPISKYELLLIIERIIDIYKRTKLIGVPASTIVADSKYVFYENNTGNVWVMCMPVKKSVHECRVKDLLLWIISRAKLMNAADVEVFNQLAGYLINQQVLDADFVEGYIYRIDSSIVDRVRVCPKTEGAFITNKRKAYYAHYSDEPEYNTGLLDESFDNTGLSASPTNGGYGCDQDDRTGILTQEDTPNEPDEEGTGILVEGESAFPTNTNTANTFDNAEENTGILNEQHTWYVTPQPYNPSGVAMNQDGNFQTENDVMAQQASFTPVQSAVQQSDPSSGDYSSYGYGNVQSGGQSAYTPPPAEVQQYSSAVSGNVTYDYGSAGQFSGLDIGQGGETTVLREQVSGACYPRLVRSVTGDEVVINKPVFRIGKERSYVDYFIFDNGAISRSHADIITRGDRFFVVDLNSKNRTFINNRVLPVNYEVEILNGDILKLANEEFVFRK